MLELVGGEKLRQGIKALNILTGTIRDALVALALGTGGGPGVRQNVLKACDKIDELLKHPVLSKDAITDAATLAKEQGGVQALRVRMLECIASGVLCAVDIRVGSARGYHDVTRSVLLLAERLLSIPTGPGFEVAAGVRSAVHRAVCMAIPRTDPPAEAAGLGESAASHPVYEPRMSLDPLLWLVASHVHLPTVAELDTALIILADVVEHGPLGLVAATSSFLPIVEAAFVSLKVATSDDAPDLVGFGADPADRPRILAGALKLAWSDGRVARVTGMLELRTSPLQARKIVMSLVERQPGLLEVQAPVPVAAPTAPAPRAGSLRWCFLHLATELKAAPTDAPPQWPVLSEFAAGWLRTSDAVASVLAVILQLPWPADPALVSEALTEPLLHALRRPGLTNDTVRGVMQAIGCAEKHCPSALLEGVQDRLAECATGVNDDAARNDLCLAFVGMIFGAAAKPKRPALVKPRACCDVLAALLAQAAPPTTQLSRLTLCLMAAYPFKALFVSSSNLAVTKALLDAESPAALVQWGMVVPTTPADEHTDVGRSLLQVILAERVGGGAALTGVLRTTFAAKLLCEQLSRQAAGVTRQVYLQAPDASAATTSPVPCGSLMLISELVGKWRKLLMVSRPSILGPLTRLVFSVLVIHEAPEHPWHAALADGKDAWAAIALAPGTHGFLPGVLSHCALAASRLRAGPDLLLAAAAGVIASCMPSPQHSQADVSATEVTLHAFVDAWPKLPELLELSYYADRLLLPALELCSVKNSSPRLQHAALRFACHLLGIQDGLAADLAQALAAGVARGLPALSRFPDGRPVSDRDAELDGGTFAGDGDGIGGGGLLFCTSSLAATKVGGDATGGSAARTLEGRHLLDVAKELETMVAGYSASAASGRSRTVLARFALDITPSPVVSHPAEAALIVHLTETTSANVVAVREAARLELPLLLEGPPGAGKTATVTVAAKLAGVRILRQNMSSKTTEDDFFGRLMMKVDKGTRKLVLVPSVYVDAYEHGHWMLLDELNLAPPETLEAILASIEGSELALRSDSAEAPLRVVKRDPGFRLFATQNPATGDFVSMRQVLPHHFLSRFTPVAFQPLPTSEWVEIIAAKLKTSITDAPLALNVAQQLVEFHHRFMDELPAWEEKGAHLTVSIRELLSLAGLVSVRLSRFGVKPWTLMTPKERAQLLSVEAWCVYGARLRTDKSRAALAAIPAKNRADLDVKVLLSDWNFAPCESAAAGTSLVAVAVSELEMRVGDVVLTRQHGHLLSIAHAGVEALGILNPQAVAQRVVKAHDAALLSFLCHQSYGGSTTEPLEMHVIDHSWLRAWLECAKASPARPASEAALFVLGCGLYAKAVRRQVHRDRVADAFRTVFSGLPDLDFALGSVPAESPFLISSVPVVLTPRMRALWLGLARAMCGPEPIVVSGVSGCGKTSAIVAFLALLGMHSVSVTLTLESDVTDIIGQWLPRPAASGGMETVFSDGPIVACAKNGDVALLEDLHCADAVSCCCGRLMGFSTMHPSAL